MENILVEQRNSFNFLLKKSQKKIINSDKNARIRMVNKKSNYIIKNIEIL